MEDNEENTEKKEAKVDEMIFYKGLEIIKKAREKGCIIDKKVCTVSIECELEKDIEIDSILLKLRGIRGIKERKVRYFIPHCTIGWDEHEIKIEKRLRNRFCTIICNEYEIKIERWYEILTNKYKNIRPTFIIIEKHKFGPYGELEKRIINIVESLKLNNAIEKYIIKRVSHYINIEDALEKIYSEISNIKNKKYKT